MVFFLIGDISKFVADHKLPNDCLKINIRNQLCGELQPTPKSLNIMRYLIGSKVANSSWCAQKFPDVSIESCSLVSGTKKQK